MSDAGMWQVQNENDGTGTMYKEANTADECTAVDLHIPGLARKELNECAVNHN